MSTATATLFKQARKASAAATPAISAPPAAGSPAQPGGRIYRGRSVEELVPKIEAELGPEAIVLRRRSGLEGGVGGFFQRPFVEIEAQRGGPRIDLYDGATETPSSAARSAPPAPSAPEQTPHFSELELTTLLGPVSGGETPPARDEFSAALAAAGLEAGGGPIRAAATRPVPARPAADIAAMFAAVAETAAPAPAAIAMPAPAATTVPAPAATTVPAPAAIAMPAPAAAILEPPAVAESPLPAAASDPLPADPAPLTRTQAAVQRELQASGIGEELARELIESAIAHVLPFSPRIGLRKAVRIALQRRIPVASPLPDRGAAIAFVGPGGSGKTRCVATLSGIYRRAASMPVGCASIIGGAPGGELRMMLSPSIQAPAQADSPRALRALAATRAGGLALLDTPSLSPAEKGEVRELARLLAQVKPDRVVVALPATLSAAAASQLLQALAPLKPDAIAITHADETDQIGVAVQAACAFGLAPEYVLSGCRGEKALARIDSAGLADRLLP